MATFKKLGHRAKTKGHGTTTTTTISNEDNLEVLQDNLTVEADSLRGRKRPSLDDMEGGDVMTMLDRFGADINKAFLTKRKRMETYTKSSLKTSHYKIEELWKAQRKDRSKVTDDYSTQFKAVFQQWDIDVQKSKDQEEKLQSMFQHQQKMFQHMRASQSQRLKTFKQLLEKYVQSLEVMEKTHIHQQESVQGELRQEMAMLQKKILMETQQQEMATVRKSLQSLLM